MDKVQKTRRTVRCLYCGSINTVKITYGMVEMDEELIAQLEAGKVILGGCMVGFDDPIRHCNNCEEDY